MIRAVEPILQRREELPDDVRAACGDVDEIIQSWHTQLGISDHDSDDE